MIDCEPMRDATTAIVAAKTERIEAEFAHHYNLILRHFTFTVVGVIGSIGRFSTHAIPAKVGDDDGEVLRQFRCDAVPNQMRLRIAVQQQQRRATAADERVDIDAVGVNTSLGKFIEHDNLYSAVRDSAR